MTSKHGGFFQAFESTPAVSAPSLSVFLTACKGKLFREGFRFVAPQPSLQMDLSQEEMLGDAGPPVPWNGDWPARQPEPQPASGKRSGFGLAEGLS
jgi:hypothetical protein